MKWFKTGNVVALLPWMALAMSNQDLSAATIQALSLSSSAVQAAINSSASGDTVLLPAGTAVWNSAVTINKPITVKGSGIGQTVITNTQYIVNRSYGEAEAFVINASVGKLTRITGIEFQGNRTAAAIHINGPTWAMFRVDHCKFAFLLGCGVTVLGNHAGLVDHCSFSECWETVSVYGDDNGSWQLPLSLGTTNSVVIEDNTFLYYSWNPWGGDPNPGETSMQGHGGRRTIRYNYWTNYHDIGWYYVIDVHGDQGTPVINNVGDIRGSRQFEMYNNIFDDRGDVSHGTAMTYLRGGTCLIYSNMFIGSHITTCFHVTEEDGPVRFNWLTNYPGYDQHWLYIWNNKLNGATIAQLTYQSASDMPFIRLGTNLFWTAPSGSTPPITSYTPLVYPHPWVTALDGGSPNRPTPPGNLRLATN